MTVPNNNPQNEAVRFVELTVDVTSALGFTEQARLRLTVALPPKAMLTPNPVVCFAQPGCGFSRHYFTLDLPSTQTGGQARWHAERGWIFVAIDPLGVGESSLHDPAALLFRPLCAAAHAAVEHVLALLKEGALTSDFPPITNPVVLGMGQSMGGGLTVVQQAHHGSYDAIAVLGYSAIHTVSRKLPGARPAAIPARTRDTPPFGADSQSPPAYQSTAANTRLLELQTRSAHYPTSNAAPPGWFYFFDDVLEEVVQWDQGLRGSRPPWRSATMPGLAVMLTTPGIIAPEAASIVVPVLAAFGERDGLEDPRHEAKAYRHAVDFSLFICPRMGHMHNFASTREVFWSRLHHWGQHVADLKQRLPEDWPAQLFSDSY